MAPFFGYSNELFEAGAPEDPAHYEMHKHWVYPASTMVLPRTLPAGPHLRIATGDGRRSKVQRFRAHLRQVTRRPPLSAPREGVA